MEESGRPRLPWTQEFAGSNPAFPTLEGVRMDEEPVLKTGGRKRLGGSIPFSSANMESDTARELSPPAKRVVPYGMSFEYSALRIKIWARCQRQVDSLARRSFGFDSHYVHSMRVWCNGSMTVSKTVDLGSSPSTRANMLVMYMECDKSAKLIEIGSIPTTSSTLKYSVIFIIKL